MTLSPSETAGREGTARTECWRWIMSDVDPVPVVAYEAYNPSTDEAPTGGDTDCDGMDQEDES